MIVGDDAGPIRTGTSGWCLVGSGAGRMAHIVSQIRTEAA